MRGSKILITGPTGQVAAPLALSLAAENEVWGYRPIHRHRSPRESGKRGGFAARRSTSPRATSAASRPISTTSSTSRSPRADAGTRTWGANAESVGLLMAHCADAKAFLHCSSAAVYDPPDDEPRTETAALGDNHKSLLPTYSISKIAGEVVARTMARALGVPTVIARLNVPYGDNGGWPFYQMEMMRAGGVPIPVPPGGPARYNPHSRGRHHRDAAEDARRRVGTRDDGQLVR